MENADNYKDKQAQRNREYEDAWKAAPKRFLKSAMLHGLAADTEEYEGATNECSDNQDDFTPDQANLMPGLYDAASYTPNMADLVDDYVDEVIEKYGSKHAVFIRAIATDLKKPYDLELIKNRSNLLARVCSILITNEKGNNIASIHALLHTIPRMAGSGGYPSLRSSADKCKVSPEWLRKQRDKWCDQLGIPVPVTGTKSDEAKEKYRKNANTNHWRNQKYIAPK